MSDTHPPTGPVDLSDVPESSIYRTDPRGWTLVSPVPEDSDFGRLVASFAASRRHSLLRVVGDPFQRARILGTRFRGDRICVAVLEGELVGYLSYRVDGKGSVWPDWQVFKREFGLVGGALRLLFTELSLRRGRAYDLYVEGYAVLKPARGQGIGRALLDWASDEVVRLGKTAWRTEVPVANENAQAVYKRYGAKLERRVDIGPFGKLYHTRKSDLYRFFPRG